MVQYLRVIFCVNSHSTLIPHFSLKLVHRQAADDPGAAPELSALYVTMILYYYVVTDYTLLS